MTLSKVKLLSAVTGITGVSATSAVLSGGGGGNKEKITSLEQTEKKPFQKPSWTHKSIPKLDSAKNIKDHYKGLECIDEYFKEIDWNNENTSSDFSDVNKFSNDKNTKSCLIIEYYKQTYENLWWWGEFRLIWSIKDELNKQGFLTVVEVKTKNSKLYGSSAAYIFKEKEKWSVSHSKVKEEKSLVNNDRNKELSEMIPQAGNAMWSFKSEAFWGFDPSDIWICETEDKCPATKAVTTHKLIHWKLSEKGPRTNLVYWCENLQSWFNSNFGWGGFMDKISHVMGGWEEVKAS